VLKDVKVGDPLLACGTTMGRERRRIVKVGRLTATQIIVTGNGRYNRTSGRLIGRGDWSTACVRTATNAEFLAVRRENRVFVHRTKLAHTNWGVIDADTIEQIWEILNA